MIFLLLSLNFWEAYNLGANRVMQPWMSCGKRIARKLRPCARQRKIWLDIAG